MRRFINVRGREMKKARVEIIPMIDTIFFLLVFFMMSSLSMVKMNGMGVSLPKANSTETEKTPPRFIVTVNKQGEFYLNLDRIEPAQLTAALQNRIKASPEGVIVVNVEKSQNVQTLINVMDSVNQVRTPDGQPAPVMIATEPINTRGEALPPAGGQ
jgi:biopolymer transport protein ExbD